MQVCNFAHAEAYWKKADMDTCTNILSISNCCSKWDYGSDESDPTRAVAKYIYISQLHPAQHTYMLTCCQWDPKGLSAA